MVSFERKFLASNYDHDHEREKLLLSKESQRFSKIECIEQLKISFLIFQKVDEIENFESQQGGKIAETHVSVCNAADFLS